VADGQQVQRYVVCVRNNGSDFIVESRDAAGSGRDEHHVGLMRNSAQQHAALKKGKHFFTLCRVQRLPRRHEAQQAKIQFIVLLQAAQPQTRVVAFAQASFAYKIITALGEGNI
jgi:hypothetical protein